MPEAISELANQYQDAIRNSLYCITSLILLSGGTMTVYSFILKRLYGDDEGNKAGVTRYEDASSIYH